LGEGEVAHLLKAMFRASCTTHTVKDETEAIQMFTFQNNRGKRLTNLELIKAEFLYTLHLQGGAERERTSYAWAEYSETAAIFLAAVASAE